MNERQRLQEFWNARYVEFSLRESGIKSLTPAYSRLLYRCKQNAYLKAVRLAGLYQRPQLEILDGGCGQGFFAEVVKRAFPDASYKGLDISEKAISFLRERFPHFTWECCDLTAQGLAMEGQYDLVQSIEVLHLIIDDENQAQAISNLASTIRIGGALIVTDTLPHVRYMANEYITFRPLAYYQQLSARLGLSIERVFPMYYCIPDGGAGPGRLRRFWRFVPPTVVYAFDRMALALRLPQWRQSHDSQMKLLVLRRPV